MSEIERLANQVAIVTGGSRGLYCSSKAAVCSLTQVAAMELAERGIRVNAVLPGLIATALTRYIPQEIFDKALARTIVGRHGTPEDIAGAVAYLVSSDSDWVTGHLLSVNGGRMN